MQFYQNRLYIITELLGYNLFEAFIKDKIKLNQVQIGSIVRDILRCLRLCKALGIVHADLKPENILVIDENSYKVKIVDFGSASFLGNSSYDYLQTRPYRAPEICFGCPIDFASDIWSLGCILYELVTSRVLFSYKQVPENLCKALSINRISFKECFSKGTKFEKC